MPTYIKPKMAHVEPGGADWGGLVLIGAGVLAAAALVAFIVAHLVLLAVCLGVFIVTMGGLVVAMRMAVSGRAELSEIEPHPVAPVAVQQAILGQPRAIAPAQHLHLHFHGLSAGDATEIINRREIQS